MSARVPRIVARGWARFWRLRAVVWVTSRLRRFGSWLIEPRRRPLTYAVMLVIAIVGCAVAFDVHERQIERHARNEAIALAIKVQHATDVRSTERIYRSQLASCGRGISLRLQVRANALAEAKVYRVLGGFLTGARPRALAQSLDMNISARSRTAARASLKSIDRGIAALSAHIAIPPVPTPCDQVIPDPNAPPAPHHS